MKERSELYFPAFVELLDDWIPRLERAAGDSPEGKIAIADNEKSFANRLKNSEGQLSGLDRRKTIEKQARQDAEVLAWADARPDRRDVGEAYREIRKLVEEKRATFPQDFLFFYAQPYWPKALGLSTTLAHAARERPKPDLERDSEFMDRNLPRVKEKLEREQKRFFPAADKALLFDFIARARKLPANLHSAALERAFPSTDSEAVTRSKIDRLYEKTQVLDLESRLQMFGETTEQLRARKDPLLDLALALDGELAAIEARQKTWTGALSRLRPVWRAAVEAKSGRPLAYDANATLRVSFAHVKGYSPRDAVTYGPQTTVSGMLEKHTGKDPFVVPEKVRAKASTAKQSRWADRALGDVPVDFLSDADTSGGNSGSPTVNGRGELVGVNFDRVWENVVNDFGYDPVVARNVNVDVRYLLWNLDQVEGAEGLLRELGARK